MQAEVNDAVGARFAGAAGPGLTTTDASTSRVVETLVRAVRPAAVPVATAAPESARSPLILPVPAPVGLVRATLVAGALQVRAVAERSLKKFTNQEPLSPTATEGAV